VPFSYAGMARTTSRDSPTPLRRRRNLEGLEGRLATWIYQQQQLLLKRVPAHQRNLSIPPVPDDDMIIRRARETAKEMFEEGIIGKDAAFELSPKWVTAFKKRYNIGGCGYESKTGKSRALENKTGLWASLSTAREIVSEVIKHADSKDVYSVEEALLFYRTLPLREAYEAAALSARQASESSAQRSTQGGPSALKHNHPILNRVHKAAAKVSTANFSFVLMVLDFKIRVQVHTFSKLRTIKQVYNQSRASTSYCVRIPTAQTCDLQSLSGRVIILPPWKPKM